MNLLPPIVKSALVMAYRRSGVAVMLYASPLLSVVVAADTVAPVCEVAVTANAVLTASADSVTSSDAAGISTVARITLSPPASVLD